MIKYFSLLYLVLLSIDSFTQQNTEDAIIVFNSEEQTFNLVRKAEGYSIFEINKKISRRIKILSNYGIEQFATLYIPTFQDLDFKTELIELKAITIKPSGSIITLTKEAIKETTLPANVPFFRNYAGQVKALAFENLEIGDEIQYDFQIIYTSSSTSPNLFYPFKTSLSENFKILDQRYIFNMKNGIQFKGVIANSNNQFVKSPSSDKQNTQYTLSIKNLKPYKSEVFSADEDNQPYFMVDIYKMEDFTSYNNWEEYTKKIKSSKRSSIFFAGKSVSDFFYLAQNESTPSRKVLKVHKLMMEEIMKNPENIYSVYKNYKPDMEDANQIFKLLNLLDINGSVLMVKNKNNGAILKDFVSLRQFDDFLVEFYENGKPHYMAIFNPYATIDEIDASYQGTEALKMSIMNKTESISFTKVPFSATSNNIAKFDYLINIKDIGGKHTTTCNLHVQKKGQFFIEDRTEYLLEKADKNYNFYSSNVASEISNSYNDCLVDTTILSKEKEQIDYQVKYNYLMPLEQSENQICIKLSDLFYSDFIMSRYDKERGYKAVFPFPFEIIRTFVIKAEEGFKVIPNEFLTRNFENQFAHVKSDYKIIDPNTIEVTLNYQIKQMELEPNDWYLFLNFINSIHDAISQRILFQQ